MLKTVYAGFVNQVGKRPENPKFYVPSFARLSRCVNRRDELQAVEENDRDHIGNVFV